MDIEIENDVLYVFNSNGRNEIYYEMFVNREKDFYDWEKYDIESNIVLEYYGFDGIGKVVYDIRYSSDEVLEEVDRINEILF